MTTVTRRSRSLVAGCAFARLGALCLLAISLASGARAAEYFYVFNYDGTQYTNNVYFDDSLSPGQI